MKAILKALISSFLGMFLHEILLSKVGQKLFHDHVTVLGVTDTTAVTEVDIADGYHYRITIEHLPADKPFAPLPTTAPTA